MLLVTRLEAGCAAFPGARYVLGATALLLLGGCATPRSILLTPEATPKGHFRIEGELGFNLPTQALKVDFDGWGAVADSLWRQRLYDTAAITADSMNGLAKTLMAYALDPMIGSAGAQIRYGLWHRLDVGARIYGATWAGDVRYQWLGPEKAADPGWRGSLGILYGAYDFGNGNHLNPSVDIIRSLLDLRFTREDIVVPLVVGKPLQFGRWHGSVGLGLAYDWSRVEWSAQPRDLVERLPGGGTRPFAPWRGDKSISAYGGFANLRLAIRRFSLVGSVSAYWQDYGTYPLYGGKSAEFSGWSLMPVLGAGVDL